MKKKINEYVDVFLLIIILALAIMGLISIIEIGGSGLIFIAVGCFLMGIYGILRKQLTLRGTHLEGKSAVIGSIFLIIFGIALSLYVFIKFNNWNIL